ncbi:hypothetical protein KBY75_12000 [Cyanobium sp. T1G-Tous]|uniref:hypothetical protein n=1 Tax=Cyanobium sp. T1G-Tous TaxID=2823722 RepID=UPI0020CF3B9E|nr:hypothetical protein [Cyanobium sp. T1G-Tous]MCP9804291.1 hypothetical protein [Cyanobium sp. T1G-Tous]
MKSYSVTIEKDEEGYLGRECPECEKYFKIKPGTGVPDFSDCYCPYCRHLGPQDHFWTKQQIEYAQSVAINKVSGDLLDMMKKMEAKPKRNQFISIGISVKGKPTPIAYYSELELEEKIECKNCALQYAIYGAFGYCPDCAEHNSQQIVEGNFGLVLKILDLAKSASPEVNSKLIENGLEDCISAFDGFARERCSEEYPKLSFQNIVVAKEKLDKFGIDIVDGLSGSEWDFVVAQFQKRHLLAHKMGVVDEEYIKKTGCHPAQLGKKVLITEVDVMSLISHLKVIVANLSKHIQRS